MEKRKRTPDFADDFKIMGLFIDNAKTYTQLSSAAIALSVTFVKDIVGTKCGDRFSLDGFLLTSWVCFLVAIGAGVSYQYLAVKFLEIKSGVTRHHAPRPEWLIKHPWPIYGMMLVAFYAGAAFFTIGAIIRLR